MNLAQLGFRQRTRVFTLESENIDRASELLVETLTNTGIDKADRLRMQLLFEEALLNIRDHYGKDQEVTARFGKQRGRYRVRLEVKGDRFNPLGQEEEVDDKEDWATSLFSVIDLNTQYSYSMGSNVLRLSLPRRTWNPVLKIIIAIVAGASIGLLGNLLIPDALQETFSSAILDPIASMWMRLLQAIAGPVIFLTMLTATFDTKRIANLGGSRLGTLGRYFAISTIVMLFTMACALPVFSLNISTTEASEATLGTALGAILRVVPENLIEPFATADTPQLLLIAIVTGYLLASLESQVGELKNIIYQLNTLGMALAKGACEVVPFFVGLLLCLKIWTHDTSLLGSIWFPLVFSAVLSLVVSSAVLITCAVRHHTSPVILARKLKGPFVAALKRGTLDFSAVDDLAATCKNLLGVNRDFARAVLPQGLFLYMPTSTIGICVFVLFAAQMQNLPIDQMWIVAAAALSVVLAVATPPMTGANLLSFVVAFSYLGITSDAFLDVMIFDLVFGVLCIAFDQAMLQIETINQAERMGFLDEKTLRAPMPEAKKA